MIVSKATTDDVLDLLMLVKKFWKESGFNTFPFDSEFMYQKLHGIITDPVGVIFVSRNSSDEITGMLVGAILPSVFSRNSIAYEVGWYTEKESRGSSSSVRLFKAYEDWARENNCISLTMSRVEGLDDEKVHKMYTKMGLELKEHNYFKELK